VVVPGAPGQLERRHVSEVAPAVIDAPDDERYGIASVRDEVGELAGYLRGPTALAPGNKSPLADERLEPYDDFDASR
jgi:hypothetical protein